MDELVLSGEKYISSKRASALTGYAKDYVGQLVRTGKVEATRVGRSWFVLERSILAHSGRQSETEQSPQLRASKKQYELNPAVLRKYYAGAGLPSTWSEISYLADNSPIMPSIISKSVPANSPVLESQNVANNIIMSDIDVRRAPLKIHVQSSTGDDDIRKQSTPAKITMPSSPSRVTAGFDGMLLPKAIVKDATATAARMDAPRVSRLSRAKRKSQRTNIAVYGAFASMMLVVGATVMIGAVSPNTTEYNLGASYAGIDPIFSAASSQFEIGVEAIRSFATQLNNYSGVYFESALSYVAQLLSR